MLRCLSEKRVCQRDFINYTTNIYDDIAYQCAQVLVKERIPRSPKSNTNVLIHFGLIDSRTSRNGFSNLMISYRICTTNDELRHSIYQLLFD